MFDLDSLINIIRGILFLTVVSFSGNTPPSTLNEASPSAQLSLLPSTSPQPSPSSTPPTTQQSQVAHIQASTDLENYLMESHPSGQDGFYILKNTPDEPMTSQSELNQAVNQYRQAHGLNTLSANDQLCEVANVRAQEASQDFSHQGFQDHIQNGDYNHLGFSQIGENLWQGSFSGVHIVEFGWDRSSGHRANLQGNWSQGCAGIHHTTVAFIFAK